MIISQIYAGIIKSVHVAYVTTLNLVVAGTRPGWHSLVFYGWCERGDSNSHSLKELDPKSSASTSSATLATNMKKYFIIKTLTAEFLPDFYLQIKNGSCR